MTTLNAAGFFLLGLLMSFLPALLPGGFPPTGMDGANTSALWLEFMGWVNDAIGAWFATCNKLLPLALRALVWKPQPLEEFVPAAILRPAIVFETDAPLGGEDEQRAVA